MIAVLRTIAKTSNQSRSTAATDRPAPRSTRSASSWSRKPGTGRPNSSFWIALERQVPREVVLGRADRRSSPSRAPRAGRAVVVEDDVAEPDVAPEEARRRVDRRAVRAAPGERVVQHGRGALTVGVPVEVARPSTRARRRCRAPGRRASSPAARQSTRWIAASMSKSRRDTGAACVDRLVDPRGRAAAPGPGCSPRSPASP